MRGRVKWFSGDRGYGFIADEDGNEVYVHRSDLPPGLMMVPRSTVEFDVKAGQSSRLRAINVRVVAPPPAPSTPPEGHEPPSE